jgi:hypothetical protein
MHTITTDKDGKPVVDAPKLKEAVGHDKVQQAEETAHKTPKTAQDELSAVEREVLSALEALGGKDVHSPEIVMHCAGVKDLKKALEKWGARGKVRTAMERLAELKLVTSKKEGVRYNFSITDKGKTALTHPTVKDSKDKRAHNPAPASTALAVTTQPPKLKEAFIPNMPKCAKCSTINLQEADFCRECGAPMRAIPA